jgi:hypothetical protein
MGNFWKALTNPRYTYRDGGQGVGSRFSRSRTDGVGSPKRQPLLTASNDYRDPGQGVGSKFAADREDGIGSTKRNRIHPEERADDFAGGGPEVQVQAGQSVVLAPGQTAVVHVTLAPKFQRAAAELPELGAKFRR